MEAVEKCLGLEFSGGGWFFSKKSSTELPVAVHSLALAMYSSNPVPAARPKQGVGNLV